MEPQRLALSIYTTKGPIRPSVKARPSSSSSWNRNKKNDRDTTATSSDPMPFLNDCRKTKSIKKPIANRSYKHKLQANSTIFCKLRTEGIHRVIYSFLQTNEEEQFNQVQPSEHLITCNPGHKSNGDDDDDRHVFTKSCKNDDYIYSNTIHRAALPSNELPFTRLTSAGFDSTQQCWIATQSPAQAYYISTWFGALIVLRKNFRNMVLQSSVF